MNQRLVYVALGSNLGDRQGILRSALVSLREHPAICELEVSSFYETPPVSDIPQPHYLNAVCRFRTGMGADALLAQLYAIEQAHGRIERSELKNAPRLLDLDLLFFGESSIATEQLQVPHPRWKERLFVLIPLAELASVIVLPEGCYELQKMIEAFPRCESSEIKCFVEASIC